MATTQGTGDQTVATTASWLTASQQRTLEALCDALIPPVQPPDGASAPDPAGLYKRSARDLNVATLVAETLALESPETRAEFKSLLDTLANPLAMMVLAGRPHGFAQLPLRAQEATLRKMSVHSLPKLRQGFQAIKRLATFIFYSAPAASGDNPNWPALDYTPPPPPPSPEAAPKRIRPLPVTGDLTLTADVVVVGSGAGGGVLAGELAAAGKDVVVVEKGGYYSESDFTGREAEMTQKLYLRRGTLATKDLGMVVLAGSCLGGGTIVNWSTSLRTPDDVLEEWQRDFGFTGAASAEYKTGFDAVEQRIGVNTADSAPNANNAALARGCDALGHPWKPIPRNASACEQRCGACGYGCPYGRKQSTMLTSLQDASERGARFVVGCQIERVLIEAGRAVGVEGWALDDATGERRKVIIRAPVVVVAAGSVESPALLMRSNIHNANIGQHLRLHPVAVTVGFYDEPVKPWTGSLQTVYATNWMNLKGNYGYWLEVAPAHPGLAALTTPWEGGPAHKQQMTRFPYEAVMIALTRDTGEGHVTLDKQGDPVLHYWPNETDRRHLVLAMQEMARIAVAGGANSVATLHTPRLQLEAASGATGVTQAQVKEYTAEIERRGIALNRVPLFSAHQMGTCRIGGGASAAVADPSGEVFGVRGLYIGDASGCPTALGVNPMITTMALAHHVAQRIKERA